MYSNKQKVELETELNLQESIVQNTQEITPPVRYFSPGSDNIIISTDSQTLYTNNPETVLTYRAMDNSGNVIHFREGDRAFVRILGVTGFFNNNTEIFHPELNGSKDYTLFSGNIRVFSEPGTYLIKVCLGNNINLNSEGVMVWPWGCFEGPASVEIKVYKK